ncbi:LacI family DNA-binding transcriptional regulator [Lacticaseibacillus absianus]|uniref:LacI family DNA-binding transcriptional regulator n=1 Tax=Lacticaseibacillus absianus TaxID=2729623 RepID=UPI0015CB72B2|nr:LacI family DNA-binding transcriptional regulator [Lacticaseibacillus absianus]
MKKITTQDIADYLKISRNTVSRSLNDQPGVSTQTKQTVLEAATMLGYDFATDSPEPSPTQPKQKIALIATDFTLDLKSFFGVILSRLKHDLRQTDYQLEVLPVTAEMRDRLVLPVQLQQDSYAGIFVLSFISNAYIEAIIALGRPTVLIDHHSPTLNADSILTENIDGTRIAINYLYTRGYRRIGFLGNTGFSPSYAERYIGFQNALAEHPDLISAPEHQITTIQEAYPNELFAQLNALDQMPDVWFTVNNGYASMLVTYLQGSGYQIPADVAILSFDDTDIAQVVTPKLTVIATDLDGMADAAWIQLQRRAKDAESPNLYIRLLPTITPRDSTR